MLNSEDEAAVRTAVWDEVPELKEKTRVGRSRVGRRGSGGEEVGFRVTDAWTGKDLGCVRGRYSVELESHDVAVLVVGERC